MCAARHGGRLVTVTRFWGPGPDALAKLDAFLARAEEYSDAVIVAVRAEDDRSGACEHLAARWPGVTALPVAPWGLVVAALNAAVSFAVRELDAALVLFQSLEVHAAPRHVAGLRAEIERDGSDVLVAGAALTHGQRFEAGEGREMTGIAAVWNTLAVWHAATLALTGFTLLSDGLYAGDPPQGEIEEVPTVALLQLRARQAGAGAARHRARLLLLEDGGVEWRLDFFGAPDTPERLARRERHRVKMRTKSVRAAAQMRALGLPPPVVDHVDARARKE